MPTRAVGSRQSGHRIRNISKRTAMSLPPLPPGLLARSDRQSMDGRDLVDHLIWHRTPHDHNITMSSVAVVSSPFARIGWVTRWRHERPPRLDELLPTGSSGRYGQDKRMRWNRSGLVSDVFPAHEGARFGTPPRW